MDSILHNTTGEQPFTVTELNKIIKELIEQHLCNIFIIGEISGYRKAQPSGHSYFVLKDENSQISCNFWNTKQINLKFDPENGKKVLIRGRLSVYLTKGTYAIDVDTIIPVGAGELQEAFEKLKEKLKAEGLFEEYHKKKIPEFPERIAVITSASGAVIEDIKKVSTKRYPLVKLYLYPVLVQGKGSVESICKAIELANKSKNNYDIIVVARGGGSLEDLWSFNDECIARAVFASDIPIVSAVGHQVDYTICDFVSDLRAATPSAAMELILPDMNELLSNLNSYKNKINELSHRKFSNLNDRLNSIESNYMFNRPKDIMNEIKIELDDKSEELKQNVQSKLDMLANDLNYKEKFLSGMSPENTLKRGFTYIKTKDKIISKSTALKYGDDISIVFNDGSKDATIK